MADKKQIPIAEEADTIAEDPALEYGAPIA